jgi:hypothetical protein
LGLFGRTAPQTVHGSALMLAAWPILVRGQLQCRGVRASQVRGGPDRLLTFADEATNPEEAARANKCRESTEKGRRTRAWRQSLVRYQAAGMRGR